jgi:hypothetical protein
MKRSGDTARVASPSQPRAYGAILVALIGSCLLIYSSVAFGLVLAWHWLTSHLSLAHWLGIALAVALFVRIYFGIRDAR